MWSCHKKYSLKSRQIITQTSFTERFSNLNKLKKKIQDFSHRPKPTYLTSQIFTKDWHNFFRFFLLLYLQSKYENSGIRYSWVNRAFIKFSIPPFWLGRLLQSNELCLARWTVNIHFTISNLHSQPTLHIRVMITTDYYWVWVVYFSPLGFTLSCPIQDRH